MSNNVIELLSDGRFTNYCSRSNSEFLKHEVRKGFSDFIKSKLRDGCRHAKTVFDQLASPQKYSNFYGGAEESIEELRKEYVAFKEAGLNG